MRKELHRIKQKLIWLTGDPTLVKRTVRGKISILIFLVVRPMLRLLLRLKLLKTWESTFSFLISDIVVRNEDGVFYCRGGTMDIIYTDPCFEGSLRDHFNLNKGVFIDVGAHIGRYTVMVGRKLSRGIVIAIEPDPDNFRILKKNVALNGLKNVIALNVAALDKNGEVTFYKIKGPHTDWHSTIVARGLHDVIKVQARRLDDVLLDFEIDRVDLMKIDVEGAEASVLKGLGLKLLNVRKMVYEYSPEGDECETISRNHGLELVRIIDFGDASYKLFQRTSV